MVNRRRFKCLNILSKKDRRRLQKEYEESPHYKFWSWYAKFSEKQLDKFFEEYFKRNVK